MAVRLLLVDSEVTQAQELEQQLQKWGYQVAGLAFSSEQALHLVENLQPEVILMNIELGGSMDGIETAALLDQPCHIPLIYLTTDAGEQTLERALQTQPAAYLIKPVALSTLRVAIQMAAEQKNSQQRISKLNTDLTARIRENERMCQEACENATRLQSLSHELINIQENERRYIARELHDEIGQALTAASMILQGAQSLENTSLLQQRLNESLSILNQALQQVRKISIDLHPSLLDDLGLVPALRWYADREATWGHFQVQMHAREISCLSNDLKLVCFRVVQEALTNISRHAQAKQVTIQLWEDDGNIHLTIHDDGQGFNVQKALNEAAHCRSLGLLGMKERVLLTGGELEIASAPNSGTEIHAQFFVSK